MAAPTSEQTQTIETMVREHLEAARNRKVRRPVRGRVLKTEDLHAPNNREALESLRGNLNRLDQVHRRLRFMLRELDTLVGDD